MTENLLDELDNLEGEFTEPSLTPAGTYFGIVKEVKLNKKLNTETNESTLQLITTLSYQGNDKEMPDGSPIDEAPNEVFFQDLPKASDVKIVFAGGGTRFEMLSNQLAQWCKALAIEPATGSVIKEEISSGNLIDTEVKWSIKMTTSKEIEYRNVRNLKAVK